MTTQGHMDVVTLQLGGETMAIPAELLREILEPVPVTRVPKAGAFAAGLINVRGAVVPLTDLRVPLGMPVTPATADTRMLVLDLVLDGGAVTVAMLADRVHDVTGIATANIEEIPSVGMTWPPGFVKGIAKWRGEFVLLPDLEKVFSQEIAAGSAMAGSLEEGH